LLRRALPWCGWIVVLALLLTARPEHAGDFEEYGLMTTALATHASPDLQLRDIDRFAQAQPARRDGLLLLRKGITAGEQIPRNGYEHARNGKYYAIHFFGFSALAVLPYRMLAALGADPFRCYLVLNAAALLVLGWAMRRLLRDPLRAFTAVLLFLACGGFLYARWSSPEFSSASLLLAALALFVTDAPVLAGLCGAAGAMQNPSLVLLAGLGPALAAAADLPASGTRAWLLRRVRDWRWWAGPALIVAAAAAPFVFCQVHFGLPSLIAKYSTDPSQIGLRRLLSFLFDLNQGMVAGVPLLMLAAVCYRWRGPDAVRNAAVTALAVAGTLAMAVPALSAFNWNSGAAGMMRYGAWCAMPLLFALLLRLRARARWPVLGLAALLAGQAAVTNIALGYSAVEFSPQARFVMTHWPALANPDPEIFIERLLHAEVPPDDRAYVLRDDSGVVRKILYRTTSATAQVQLCGPGHALLPSASEADAGRGWRYLNGAVRCAMPRRLDAAQITAAREGLLGGGWSANEPNGVWSIGKESRITISVTGPTAALTLRGHYFDPLQQTRVTVNGIDFGWQQLEPGHTFMVEEALRRHPGTLDIELEHRQPRQPGPQDADQRTISFFIQEIVLQ
jgi:hypothetical protein